MMASADQEDTEETNTNLALFKTPSMGQHIQDTYNLEDNSRMAAWATTTTDPNCNEEFRIRIHNIILNKCNNSYNNN